MCYAYKDRDVEEVLLEHLVETGRCCLGRWEMRAISNKISRTINIDADSIRIAIELSALLHDIRKSASIYQERGSRGLCTEFPGHYMLSTFLVHLTYSIGGIDIRRLDVANFLRDRFSELSRDKIIAIIVLLPIALHHYHQVEGLRSYRATNRRDVEIFWMTPASMENA